MLPLLTLAGDGAVHSVSEAVDVIANELGLTSEERTELLPSGRQTRLVNRVHWARAHLKAAGLLEAAGRGKFVITAEGSKVLEAAPAAISMKFLEPFLEGFGARKGVMITTSSFSSDAHEYVGKIERRVVLIDGERLAELMIDHDVGVSPLATYRIKRVDEDFFEDEVPIVAEAIGAGGDVVEVGA